MKAQEVVAAVVMVGIVGLLGYSALLLLAGIDSRVAVGKGRAQAHQAVIERVSDPGLKAAAQKILGSTTASTCWDKQWRAIPSEVLGGGNRLWVSRVEEGRLEAMAKQEFERCYSLEIRGLQALSQPQGLDALLSAAPPVR